MVDKIGFKSILIFSSASSIFDSILFFTNYLATTGTSFDDTIGNSAKAI